MINPFTATDIGSEERARLILEWIGTSPQPFNVRRHMTNDPEVAMIYERICERFVDEEILEYCRNERGWYRPRQLNLDPMEMEGLKPEPVDIWLPFGIHEMVEIYQGNIIMVAGAKSSGKTCVALNMLMENEGRFDRICYFNSEMGAHELKKRLDMFYRPKWEAEFYSRYKDFDAAVQPGEKTLNVVDFLEIHDEFYAIGNAIKAIHDNLRDSVCVIFLQKNPGQDMGLGGWRSIEVSRLYLSMEKGNVKITDAKNWTSPDNNPNGKMRDFKIHSGTKLTTPHGWYRVRGENDEPATT